MAVGWMTLGDWKVGPRLLKCVPQGWLRGGGGIQAQGRGHLAARLGSLGPLPDTQGAGLRATPADPLAPPPLMLTGVSPPA